MQFKDTFFNYALPVLETFYMKIAKTQAAREFIPKAVKEYEYRLRESQIFVVDSSIANSVTKIKRNSDSLKFALPFKNCFFQTAEQNKTIASFSVSEIKTDVFALIASEVSPGIYEGQLFTLENQKDIRCERFTTDPLFSQEEGFDIIAANILSLLCEHIHSCNLGSEKVYRTVNTKTRTLGKSSFKVNHVIRLSPKISRTFPEPAYSRDIDWSMQWWVRGHWRKLPSSDILGKGRDDQYNVKGFTWVAEHLKGPENKPIRKAIYKTGEIVCQ